MPPEALPFAEPADPELPSSKRSFRDRKPKRPVENPRRPYIVVVNRTDNETLIVQDLLVPDAGRTPASNVATPAAGGAVG